MVGPCPDNHLNNCVKNWSNSDFAEPPWHISESFYKARLQCRYKESILWTQVMNTWEHLLSSKSLNFSLPWIYHCWEDLEQSFLSLTYPFALLNQQVLLTPKSWLEATGDISLHISGRRMPIHLHMRTAFILPSFIIGMPTTTVWSFQYLACVQSLITCISKSLNVSVFTFLMTKDTKT